MMMQFYLNAVNFRSFPVYIISCVSDYVIVNTFSGLVSVKTTGNKGHHRRQWHESIVKYCKMDNFV